MIDSHGKIGDHATINRHGFMKGTSAKMVLVVASIVFVTNACGWAQERSSQSPAARSNSDVTKELELKIKLPFTIATVGDLIEPQPITSTDPSYQQLINIIRNADVGFANMESTLVDLSHFPGPFGDIMATMEVGPAIKEMGIKIVNRANNHDFDGGIAGMFSTDVALDNLGIVHAGTGNDLYAARTAKYLATPKGRIGLVGMVSFDDVSPFGPNFKQTEATYRGAGYTGGAPGVNALRLTTYHIVTPEQLQSLRAIRDASYGNTRAARAADASTERTDQLKFFDEWYQAGANPGALSYIMNPNDEREILRSVRNGKILSDFMIATIHVHQTTTFATQGTGSGADPMPPDFLISLAHECIDNGADIFVGHGVHNLRGVEIYKGKPIFYGMSAFVFQRAVQYGVLDQLLASPKGLSSPAAGGNLADQISLLATSHYEEGRLVEVRLYPVDRGDAGRPVSQQGIPMTPSPEMARRILEDMQTWSKPFGTTITIEDNVGVIRVPPGASGGGSNAGTLRRR